LIYVPSSSLAGVGLTIQNIAIRDNIAESTTLLISPAAGEHHEMNIYGEAMPGGTASPILSANRTNNMQGIMDFSNNNQPRQMYHRDTNASGLLSGLAPIFLNDASDLEWTSGAMVGTYRYQRIGRIMRQA